VKVQDFPWAEFPHSVGLHNSCSSIRGLGLAKPSEIMGTPFNKMADLLAQVPVLIGVHVDYRDHHKIFAQVHESGMLSRMRLGECPRKERGNGDKNRSDAAEWRGS
jgi:hypothetical protein